MQPIPQVSAALSALALLAMPLASESVAASPKPTIPTPTLTCGKSGTTFIDLLFTAGASPGAPAGFSIQWMTAADFAQWGWPSSSDCAPDLYGNPTCPTSFCKGSFSGNANLSRYNLGSFEPVMVEVGDFLFDNGASTSDACAASLVCGETYVFRTFAHATNTYLRSAFTEPLTCSTLACEVPDACTYTIGYWKTHNDSVCDVAPESPLCVKWPVASLTLGTVSYDRDDLVAILNQTPSGNGLIALAHQLIAAKLNNANGADATAIADVLKSADAMVGGLVVPPIGDGVLKSSVTSALTKSLDAYNTGVIGPGHCD